MHVTRHDQLDPAQALGRIARPAAAPRPPSVVAEPPTPTITRRAPASTAPLISSPVPVGRRARPGRCPRARRPARARTPGPSRSRPCRRQAPRGLTGSPERARSRRSCGRRPPSDVEVALAAVGHGTSSQSHPAAAAARRWRPRPRPRRRFRGTCRARRRRHGARCGHGAAAMTRYRRPGTTRRHRLESGPALLPRNETASWRRSGARRPRLHAGPAGRRHRRDVDRGRHHRRRPRGGAARCDRGRRVPRPLAGPRPRRLPARLRRGGQRHAVVRAPRVVRRCRADPASTAGGARRGRPTGGSTTPSPRPSSRRPPDAASCSCRTTTSASLVAAAGSAAARPAPRPLRATPRSRPSALRALPDRRRPRAARRTRRPPRLRVPRPPVGRRLRGERRRRAGRRARTLRRSPAADRGRPRAGRASAEACEQAASLDEPVGDRSLLVRVDRIELSKNLIRGFLAFDDLLERRPERRDRVVFGAFVYPSREGLPEYLAYRQEVEATGRARQRALGHARTGRRSCSTRPTTSPVRSPRCGADVLLVNPIRDGLNLVAKEGTLLNERDVVLVLSRGGRGLGGAREGALERPPLRRGRHGRGAGRGRRDGTRGTRPPVAAPRPAPPAAAPPPTSSTIN